MAGAATRSNNKNGNKQAAALPVIPFTHAAHEHIEPAFDVSRVLNGNVQQLGPFDVPAAGYLRNIWMVIDASGGEIAESTLADDAPWNVLSDVSLEDVNGAPIFGPYNGYEVYLANKWGGYQFLNDPAIAPNVAIDTVDFRFVVRIPVEISHKTGLGALSNMNASANYKVKVSLASLATVFPDSDGEDTAPTVRVRAYLEAWTLPNPMSRDGLPQATLPPLHGTAQYWSKFIKTVTQGENTIILPRVGNQIRNLIAISRDSEGVRDSDMYPDTNRFTWDQREILNEPKIYRENVMFERFGHQTSGVDTGVFVYDFSHDVVAHPGGEDDGHLWLRTVQATRLEFVGNFSAAGTITILTNDVAPVALTNRYEENSASGGVPGEGEGFMG